MKILVSKTITETNRNLMRKLGYFENYDRHTGKTSYIRRLGRESFYPRFHIYIDENEARVINLHLDQKRPSYQGASAHNAEYSGEAVEREIARMKRILDAIAPVNAAHTETKKEKKKGFWSKFKTIFRG